MYICGLNGEAGDWVNDWYNPTYYQHSPILSPQGPATATKKVYRGGTSSDDPGLKIPATS